MVIARIKKMEARFDRLQAAVNERSNSVCGESWFRNELALLLDYYEGGQWLRDYELDKAGGLPADLKRGVLSQDAVYDFLTKIQSI